MDATPGTPPRLQEEWPNRPLLAASIFGQPLVYQGLVIVATKSNDVYGLDEGDGHIRWQVNVGTPVPSSALPKGCQDGIPGTVGIISTPVIDPATGKLFLVADIWDGAHAHHHLFRLDAKTGAIDQTGGTRFERDVDPPGSIPENQLQRASLNLAGGRVQIGFGGNPGDCAQYWGWLVSAPEASATDPLKWWRAPAQRGAAIWAPGGPAVDGAGNVYVGTGNGFSDTTFDHGETLEKFDSLANEVDWWAPSSWRSDNDRDLDIGSVTPALLPNDLVFQAGKNGNGYCCGRVRWARRTPTTACFTPRCAGASAPTPTSTACSTWPARTGCAR